MLRQNHSCSSSCSKRAVTALSYAVEAIAGSDYPCVRCRALQVLAEVLENSGVFRRERCEVVDRLIDSCCQACSRHIVTKNPAINDLSKERGLRDQFPHQMRDVLLSFRSEGLLVARSSAKCDHDDLALRRSAPKNKLPGSQQRASQCEARSIAQKLPATAADGACDLVIRARRSTPAR